jgi:hypothetical protein
LAGLCRSEHLSLCFACLSSPLTEFSGMLGIVLHPMRDQHPQFLGIVLGRYLFDLFRRL